jgi:hypothetical protein
MNRTQDGPRDAASCVARIRTRDANRDKCFNCRTTHAARRLHRAPLAQCETIIILQCRAPPPPEIQEPHFSCPSSNTPRNNFRGFRQAFIKHRQENVIAGAHVRMSVMTTIISYHTYDNVEDHQRRSGHRSRESVSMIDSWSIIPKRSVPTTLIRTPQIRTPNYSGTSLPTQCVNITSEWRKWTIINLRPLSTDARFNN